MKQNLIDSPFFLQVSYVRGHEFKRILADPAVLAVFAQADSSLLSQDPRFVQIPLARFGPPILEIWKCKGPIQIGHRGDVSWASNGELFFGKIERDESTMGLEACTEQIYQQISDTLKLFAMPTVLRIWNTIDAICEGTGDDERYRRFCLGRARGMRFFPQGQFPAATAVGRQDGRRVVQVYWLASSRRGYPFENPRQTSAYQYPRIYGPQPPLFARAMLAPAPPSLPLFISGTAAVVGHVSKHKDNVAAQLDDIAINLRVLLQRAQQINPASPSWFTCRSCLKVYIHDVHWVSRIEKMLARLFSETPRLLLHATVCRKDLLLEIEAIHW